MGIPIDGTEAEMFSKLKEKGFRETNDPNILEGLFEDLPVEVVVLDNSRDKVYEMDLRHEMGRPLWESLQDQQAGLTQAPFKLPLLQSGSQSG